MNRPKKVLMLVHTLPPFGTVGGSIRLIQFLNRGGNGWKTTVVTLDPDTNPLWLAKESPQSILGAIFKEVTGITCEE